MAVRSGPVTARLVPDVVPALPDGFTRLVQPLVAGPVQRIPLPGGLELILVVPTGLAAQWRDADPAAVVSRSDDALRSPPDGGTRAAAPVRLLVRRAGTVVASVPLVANLRRRVPDSGGDDRSVGIELIVLSWHLHAGTLRGPGRFGSRIEIGWRPTGPWPSDMEVAR